MSTFLTLFATVLRKLTPAEVDMNFINLRNTADAAAVGTTTTAALATKSPIAGPGSGQAFATGAFAAGAGVYNLVYGPPSILSLDPADSRIGAVVANKGVFLKYANATGVGELFGYDYVGGVAKDIALNSPGACVLVGTFTNNGSGAKLQVAGNTSVSGNSTVAGNIVVAGDVIFNASLNKIGYATNFYRINNSTNTHSWFIDPGNQVMALDTSGNLLVGVTSGLGHYIKKTAGTTVNALMVENASNLSGDGGLQIKLGTNCNDANSALLQGLTGGTLKFQVTGAGNVLNTNNSYGAISDLKLKENISTARNYLDDLCKVNIVKYSLKSESSATATHLGVIAQELEEVFPGMIEETKDTEERQKVEDGKPLFEKVQATDDLGNLLLDTVQFVFDEEGNQKFEEKQKLDSEGMPLFAMVPTAIRRQKRTDSGTLIFVPGPELGTFVADMEDVEELIPAPIMERIPTTTASPLMVDDITRPVLERYETGEVTKGVKYSIFVPMLITAVQELSVQNKMMEARLLVLEGKAV